MAYIVKNDFISVVKLDVVDAISDSTQLTKAISQAETDVFSYIRPLYDVAEVKKQTGTNRNEMIIMVMVDIALYHLHARISPSEIPTIRQTRYDDAKKWLEDIADGKIDADLPAIAEDKSSSVRYGSNKPFQPYY